MPRRSPAEFRRKVLDLVAAGRPVAQAAFDLQISAQIIYTWRRQQLIDSGQIPGMTSTDNAEMIAARCGSRNWKRAGDPPLATELLGDVVPQKAVRGDHSDRRRSMPLMPLKATRETSNEAIGRTYHHA